MSGEQGFRSHPQKQTPPTGYKTVAPSKTRAALRVIYGETRDDSLTGSKDSMPKKTHKSDNGSANTTAPRESMRTVAENPQNRQFQLEFDFESRPNVARLSPDDVYALASKEMLDKLKEGSLIERKAPGMHVRALSDYICMWANTSPDGGLIVVGQDDDGKIPGMKSVPISTINDLEKCGTTYSPDARYHVRRVPIGEDNFCLLFRVEYHSSRVVETVAGDAFVRRGDSKYRLSDEEKHQLAIDKGQTSHEQEPSGLSFPDDFELSQIQKFVAAVISTKGLRTDNSLVRILCNRRLGIVDGTGTFIPNVACALLFAKEPQRVIPGATVRFQKFDGTQRLTGERRNVVKDIPMEGRIPELIAQADAAIQSQIRDYSRLGPGGKFFTAPEYPRPAWYEALVNACVHRSYYLKNMNIFIRMFDDRLEIESPGGFPPLVTPDNIYDIHHRRNFFLMDALFYMDLVKCENEGTRRIRDEMIAMELPAPEFSAKNTEVGHAVVKVTLRNDHERRKLWIDKSAADLVGEAIFSQLDERERRCINFAAENSKITSIDAARLLGADWKTGRKLLDRLVGMRLLVRISRYRGDSKSHYRLPTTKASPT